MQSALFSRFSLFFFFFFLLTITTSGHLAKSRWCIYSSKSQKILSVSFSRTDSRFYIYYLFVWSNLNFLHNSQWITFPAHSWLVLYSFCANLFCNWSFRLYHYKIYICYFVASCLFFLWHSESLWDCFVLLSKEIQFPSLGFTFSDLSKFSHVKFRLFVAWNVYTVVFLPIFVSWLFLFCWWLYCLYHFWSLCFKMLSCSTFFNVVFDSLYQCIDAIFNPDKLSFC